MNVNEVVERLKQEAQNNQVASDVFHVLAVRRRARSELTLRSLYNKMTSEGFKHTSTEYSGVLELLGALELGTVQKNQRGRVKALVDVRATVESIGKAALGIRKDLAYFFPRDKVRRHVYAPKPRQIPKPVVNKVNKINLELIVNGKSLSIAVPNNFDKEDLVSLIGKLQSA